MANPYEISHFLDGNILLKVKTFIENIEILVKK